MGIPVLFIRGTKGSGKTKFIEESLINGDFGDVGKALVLKLENGEAEYDEAKLSGKNAFVSSILNLNDFKDVKGIGTIHVSKTNDSRGNQIQTPYISITIDKKKDLKNFIKD